MWWRIFARSDEVTTPADLLEHLERLGLQVEAHFRGDDLGWTGAELRCGVGSPTYIERWLTDADDIRQDLVTWAAWLESQGDYQPQALPLMGRIIQTRQLITVRQPIDHADEIMLEKLCTGVSRYLALRGEGIYQCDNAGFFDSDGVILVREY